VVVGAALSVLVSGAWIGMLGSPLSLVIYLAAVGLTAAAAVGKIRYL
jgi:hypothetical protein